MYETINEKVDVVAVFGTSYLDLRPHKIKWNGKEYTISKVGYVHKVREGQKVIHVFSCTDGAIFFELRFDSHDLKWILGRTWDGEAT